MSAQNRVLFISFSIFIAAFCAAGISIFNLYNVSLGEQTERLVELAQSQARMMEAISEFVRREDDALSPEEVRNRTLEAVRASHSNFRGFGESGEFTLAERHDDQIVFLLSHRHYDLDQPRPVMFESDIAEPMRRALSGYSGTVVGLDYRGESVLAAHEPVTSLDLGIVAKIDLREIRAPFVSAGILSFGACIIVNILCASMAHRILIPMIDQANRASHAKTAFLARMSHEFRTPLNAIIGFSDIMRCQIMGPIANQSYRGYAEDIYVSGNQMLDLVNDVLDVSKIEVGERNMEKESFEVRELMEGVVKSFEGMANAKRLHIALSISDKMPRLYADKRSILQIVNNILSNACKFSHEGGDIVVSGMHTAGSVMIEVKDFGEGIPHEDLPTIFDPFAQAQSNPEIAKEGTGLGLSIVKSLVEAHNGHVVIESVFGEGTTVTVDLPLAVSEQGSGAAAKVRLVASEG